ncbi:hypothetical protein [Frigoribacterium sp. CFBP 13707]|uniref:DUF7657 domain-containing protein n=1 Tax=Frigoribacterium sp. CFBP 13707 TaxID=2775313 RepID=UPI001780A207|nr:hypothetical protein [Frigoribacterium sp. CFBP 13707]MBD8727299.1 hypothetical protein [Frigoribacterium sp. CFBP 13707]
MHDQAEKTGPHGAFLGAAVRLTVLSSRLVAPRPSGAPALLVLLGYPAVVLVVFVVLVVLGVSGSSTGSFWEFFGRGPDPDLIAGVPRKIRTDEWLVQSGWVVSQAQQGFPAVNQTLPGGMDATVQNDLPSWDWSTLFRPHVWGFLVLPLDQGMAVRWWLPFAALLIAAYGFAVTLMPRRPVTAALLATALGASPLLQWWFLPTTLWPVAWAATALTTLVWCLRPGRRRVRWAAAAVTAYVTVTMTMSIYVPFIVPAAVVVVVVGVGLLLDARLGLRRSVGALLPLLAAVGAAGVVLGAWIVTRLDTVRALLGTVYPGQRLEATGAIDFGGAVAAFSGPFQRALQDGETGALGPNASETAAPLVIGLAMSVVLVWLVSERWRRERRIDAVALSVVVAHAVVLAFLFVPHWDALAHLLLLDRTTVARVRSAFDLLNLVSVVVATARLDALRARSTWSTAVLAGLVVLAPSTVVWAVLRATGSTVLSVSSAWTVVVALLVVAVVAASRRVPLVGAGAFLAASLVVGLGVNPLYRGVFDLTETDMGREVAAVAAQDPDAQWLGIGTFWAGAVLVESGVSTYNGVQTAPPEEMWDEIDDDASDEDAWNRLANVSWVPGVGEPTVTNPYRDQIQVTFDACSAFAQEHVDYVVSESRLDDPCAVEVDREEQGSAPLWLYRVD